MTTPPGMFPGSGAAVAPVGEAAAPGRATFAPAGAAAALAGGSAAPTRATVALAGAIIAPAGAITAPAGGTVALRRATIAPAEATTTPGRAATAPAGAAIALERADVALPRAVTALAGGAAALDAGSAATGIDSVPMRIGTSSGAGGDFDGQVGRVRWQVEEDGLRVEVGRRRRGVRWTEITGAALVRTPAPPLVDWVALGLWLLLLAWLLRIYRRRS